jgi:hypothetical protein
MSKQIRLKCLDCCGGQHDEVKFCLIPDCPLWHFRFGSYPRTYIKAHGEKASVLFDANAFSEEGIFKGDMTAEDAKQRYNRWVSRDEQVRSKPEKK